MRLTSELPMDAPLERTWAALLAADPPDGAWRGILNGYAGSVHLDDVDEDDHTAGFYLQGRELRGDGLASARITTHLAGDGAGTRLLVETDLNLAGSAVQLDRASLQEATDNLLGRLVAHLEQALAGPPPPPPPPSDELVDGRLPPDVLAGARRQVDLVGAAAKVAERALLLVLGALLGLVLGRTIWGRR